MSGAMTWILCSGSPATIAYSVRCACGACVVHHRRSLPVTLSKSATAPHVSSGHGWTRWNGCACVERATRVRHHGERLVLDVDQLERVARRVAVVGDDEGHLLALEAHL